MDNETKVAIQHLSDRMAQTEKTVATLTVSLAKNVSLVHRLMEEMTTSISNEVNLLKRTKALENQFKALEKSFADMTNMLTPQVPGELTISDAIQKLVYTVGKITDEMLLYRRNMREAPPSGSLDEDPLISPILH